MDSEPLPSKHPHPPRLDFANMRGQSTRSLFSGNVASPSVGTSQGAASGRPPPGTPVHFNANASFYTQRGPSGTQIGSPTSTYFDATSVGTAGRAAKVANAERAIISAIQDHEHEVAKLVKLLLLGAAEFRLAASYGQQNEAFTPTTEQLRVVRVAALRLVTNVRRWQRRVRAAGGGIDAKLRGLAIHAPATARGGTPTPTPGANTPAPGDATPDPASGGGGDNDRRDVGTPPPRERLLASCRGTLPPPFYWNGQEVLVALGTSLDFLSTVPELVRYVGAWPCPKRRV